MSSSPENGDVILDGFNGSAVDLPVILTDNSRLDESENGSRKRKSARKSWWTRSYLFDYAAVTGLLIMLILVWVIAHPADRFLPDDDPQMMYPYEDQTVPTYLLFVLAVLLPIAVMSCFLVIQRLLNQIDNSTLAHNLHHIAYGFIFIVILSLLVVEVLKVSIGRYRPNFLAARAQNPSDTEEAQLSWPSGHSALSFACCTFLSYFLSTKLGLRSKRYAGRLWLMLVCWSPYALSFFIAASRIFDYWHHPSDVMAGIVIGLLIGFLSVTQIFDEQGRPYNRLKDRDSDGNLIVKNK